MKAFRNLGNFSVMLLVTSSSPTGYSASLRDVTLLQGFCWPLGQKLSTGAVININFFRLAYWQVPRTRLRAIEKNIQNESKNGKQKLWTVIARINCWVAELLIISIVLLLIADKYFFTGPLPLVKYTKLYAANSFVVENCWQRKLPFFAHSSKVFFTVQHHLLSVLLCIIFAEVRVFLFWWIWPLF